MRDDCSRRLRFLQELHRIRRDLRRGTISPFMALNGVKRTKQRILTPEQVVQIKTFTETFVKLGTEENAKVARLLSSILIDDDPVSLIAL